jgi:L-alanine-DL-glutamate epimerase-like enolase superfamily enzyme
MINLSLLPSNPLQQNSFSIKSISTYIFKAPVKKPVVSTLTTVNTRVALLVKVEDIDGIVGWGEIYATLPSFAADHKRNIVHQILFPLLKKEVFETPQACWSYLESKTLAMQIQTGEFGPFSSAIAGIDCAIWDLLARKNHLPLAEFLGGERRPLPAYASGLNPADGPEVVEQSRELGFTAFKQKIGFGESVDKNNLSKISSHLQKDEQLFVDVNQGWTIAQVRQIAPMLNSFPLHWVEEPLIANASVEDWLECASLLNAPLAGGENLRGDDFAKQSDWLKVIQPDVGKWGGVTGNSMVAKAALNHQLRYCPHWLGSGLGLMTSAHVLSAIGGNGLLEMDVNENPLREILAEPFPTLQNGQLNLPDQIGIGVVPNLEKANPWLTHYQESII